MAFWFAEVWRAEVWQFRWLMHEEEELAVAVRSSSVFRRVFAMTAAGLTVVAASLLLWWCVVVAMRE